MTRLKKELRIKNCEASEQRPRPPAFILFALDAMNERNLLLSRAWKRVLIVSLMALVLFGCGRSRDSEIIGKWIYRLDGSRSGITFSPDHTFAIWSEDEGEHRELLFGVWHIEGNEVVRDFKEDFASRQTIPELHRDFSPYQDRQLRETIERSFKHLAEGDSK